MIAVCLVMVVEYGHDQFLTILKDAQDIDPDCFTAVDVFNSYRSSIQDTYTKILQSLKNPDGSIPDLSNVAVRQRVLAENPDIRKKAAQAASMNALATLLGDRIGAFSGTIAKVIKPEISEIIKFGLETGASNSSQKAFEGLTKRPDK
ncbi:MAG: hypothetical protein CMM78_01065 [Rhodospirillaceae bacterium]|jgi:glycerate-2-kinase|nr:hypothetical protein [Rhodospirillales bacterium]MAX46772.1 hypothetical protein [Rhodospirillaceae bacterium]|tara:strand:+ start:17526 stop:17969 length:444 start_codon:yes stop_codon:yes gene_type:complete